MGDFSLPGEVGVGVGESWLTGRGFATLVGRCFAPPVNGCFAPLVGRGFATPVNGGFAPWVSRRFAPPLLVLMGSVMGKLPMVWGMAYEVVGWSWLRHSSCWLLVRKGGVMANIYIFVNLVLNI